MSISTNEFLNSVLECVGKIGDGRFKKLLIRIYYFFRRLFPSEKVLASRKYFDEKRNEVETVIGLLNDEDSKRIYQKMIEFRTTDDLRVHPDYTLDDQYFVENIISLGDNEVFVDAGGVCRRHC